MDASQDLFAILGVPPDAEQDEVDAAYENAVRRLHPDNTQHEGAKLQFKNVAEAYSTLGNERQRRLYSRARQRLAPEPEYFKVALTPSKQVLPILGEPQIVYVLVEISPNRNLKTAQREQSPLNLALVLDRSSSMRGPRLDRVKVAAHQIIDQLDEGDYLSLITFSDRADVLIKSTAVADRDAMKSRVNTMLAHGGTEIYQGLSEGMHQIRRHLHPEYVNHIILLTDGDTFDDERLSLQLANEAAHMGIGLSAMGIGDEWNDVFLDELASITGGSSAYINSPGAVTHFMHNRVRALGSTFAERLILSLAPDPDITLESVFKLVPSPQPITLDRHPLHVGSLERTRSTSLLVQLQMPNDIIAGRRSLIRVETAGDVLHARRQDYKIISDLSIDVAQNPAPQEPPRAILDALGKLTLYRMQQKAEEALARGNIDEATHRLERLATRLLEVGHSDLSDIAKREASRIRATHVLSEEGRKAMKYGTRMLLTVQLGEDAI